MNALLVEEAGQDLGDELGAKTEEVVVPDDDLEELERNGSVREIDDLAPAGAKHHLAELRERELGIIDAVVGFPLCALELGERDLDECTRTGRRDGLACASDNQH